MDIAKIRKKAKEGLAETREDIPSSPVLSGPPVSGDQEPEPPPSAPEQAPQIQEEAPADTLVDILSFELAREEYAFKIEDIAEIVRLQQITRIPKSAPYLLGVASLRGKMIPVIDLKTMLSLKREVQPDVRKQKILILKGSKGPVGALVDAVIGVSRPALSKIVQTPAHLPEAGMRFIENVAIVEERFVSIMHLGETVGMITPEIMKDETGKSVHDSSPQS